jgi:predicted amidophosphoribosyltransferase
MLCPRCGFDMPRSFEFCPKCGNKMAPEKPDPSVKSMEAWKLKKSEEKDLAKKEKVAKEKDKLETIKERMYAQQAGFNVDEILAQQKKKDEKEKKKSDK